MKMTIEIPEKDLKEVRKNTGFNGADEAILMAVREFNRRRLSAALASGLKGALPQFMSADDLKRMRQDVAKKNRR